MLLIQGCNLGVLGAPHKRVRAQHKQVRLLLEHSLQPYAEGLYGRHHKRLRYSNYLYGSEALLATELLMRDEGGSCAERMAGAAQAPAGALCHSEGCLTLQPARFCKNGHLERVADCVQEG